MTPDVVNDLILHIITLYSSLITSGAIVYFAVLFVRRLIHI